MTWEIIYNELKKNKKHRIALGIILIFIGSLLFYKGIMIERSNPTNIWCYQCQIRRGVHKGSKTIPPIWLCEQCTDFSKIDPLERPNFSGERKWYNPKDLKDGAVSGTPPSALMIPLAFPIVLIGTVLLFIKNFQSL
jgi:uncharacterized membrane protein